MTKIEKARVALYEAATRYYKSMDDRLLKDMMDASAALEKAAIVYANQWKRELKEYREIANAHKKANQ